MNAIEILQGGAGLLVARSESEAIAKYVEKVMLATLHVCGGGFILIDPPYTEREGDVWVTRLRARRR